MILTQTRYSSLYQNSTKKNSEADSSIYSKDSSYNFNSADEQNLENNISSFSEINDSQDELNKKSFDCIQMKKIDISNNYNQTNVDSKLTNEDSFKKINKPNKNDTTNSDFKSNDTNKENIDVSSYVDCYSSMLLELDNDFDKITQNNDQLNGLEDSLNTPLNAFASDSSSTISGIQKKFIVKIVTVFAVIFFLLCFAMVAFTLRMSEKIDAQIRDSHMKQNAISNTTKFTLNIIQQQHSKSKTTNMNYKNRLETNELITNRSIDKNIKYVLRK